MSSCTSVQAQSLLFPSEHLAKYSQVLDCWFECRELAQHFVVIDDRLAPRQTSSAHLPQKDISRRTSGGFYLQQRHIRDLPNLGGRSVNYRKILITHQRYKCTGVSRFRQSDSEYEHGVTSGLREKELGKDRL